MQRNYYAITIEMSRYSKDVNGGREYYSASCYTNFASCYGHSCPCDTEKEVVDTVTDFLKKQHEGENYENHRPPTLKNTEFENSVAELRYITLEYLLAKVKGYEQKSLEFLMIRKES